MQPGTHSGPSSLRTRTLSTTTRCWVWSPVTAQPAHLDALRERAAEEGHADSRTGRPRVCLTCLRLPSTPVTRTCSVPATGDVLLREFGSIGPEFGSRRSARRGTPSDSFKTRFPLSSYSASDSTIRRDRRGRLRHGRHARLLPPPRARLPEGADQPHVEAELPGGSRLA